MLKLTQDFRKLERKLAVGKYTVAPSLLTFFNQLFLFVPGVAENENSSLLQFTHSFERIDSGIA